MTDEKTAETIVFPRDGLGSENGSSNRVSSIMNPNARSEKSSDNQAQSEIDDGPPDGGLRAWLVVLGAWCSMFCTYGWLNSAGTFQSYYQLTVLSDYTASDIAWISSLLTFCMLAMGPVVGNLFDRFGPRYLIIGGSFLHVFGLMMASISTKYYQLILSQGLCSAIGLCAVYQPPFTSIPTWFERKRGLAYGIASTGSSIGGVIFPIMISRLITSVGYGWAMRIAAFMMLGLLVITIVTVDSRTPPQPKPMTTRNLIQPFRELPMVLLTFAFFLLGLGVFIPSSYSIIQAIQQGMSSNLAQYLLPMLNASSLFGRLTAGFLADKMGVFNIMIVSCYVAGILTIALWIPVTNNAGNIMFCILFGFAIGAYETLATALVATVWPLKEIGYRTGLLFVLASVSGLTAGPIAGAIQQSEGGSYVGMKVFAGVMLISGSACVMVTRFYKTGLVLWTKF